MAMLINTAGGKVPDVWLNLFQKKLFDGRDICSMILQHSAADVGAGGSARGDGVSSRGEAAGAAQTKAGKKKSNFFFVLFFVLLFVCC